LSHRPLSDLECPLFFPIREHAFSVWENPVLQFDVRFGGISAAEIVLQAQPGLDAIYGAELDGTRARKGALIAHVLRSERALPESTVMLGDRRHDVEGARANGLRSLGVTYGYGDRAELEGAGATWICDDLATALAVLDAAVR
jgi:phosphoglycolate phosphatase-like HAD superfamily hydrolase